MSFTTPPPYGEVGVTAALKHSPNDPAPSSTLFSKEFSLADRVALVTGGHRGLGLEMALTLIEAGARAVYCVDLLEEPNDDWKKVRDWAANLTNKGGEGRLEYISTNVCDQEAIWKVGQDIGDKEGRLDICIAAAGIVKVGTGSLDLPAQVFRDVLDVNTTGVFFTAQAAGRQMRRFGKGGSIILIASISGSGALRGSKAIGYEASKSAVLQIARTMACELAPQKIRVNTLSPGYIPTPLVSGLIESDTAMAARWADQNPMARLGRPDELRGAIAWLASDASSFCTGTDIEVSGGHHAW